MSKRKRPLVVVNVRIPSDHATKLHWLAADTNTTAADLLRSLVAHAIRDVMPPENAKSCEVLAESGPQWEKWEKLAAARNCTVGQLASKLLTRAAERVG